MYFQHQILDTQMQMMMMLSKCKNYNFRRCWCLQYYNGSAWVDVTLNQVITATDIAANKLRLNPAAMKMDLLTLLLILQ